MKCANVDRDDRNYWEDSTGCCSMNIKSQFQASFQILYLHFPTGSSFLNHSFIKKQKQMWFYHVKFGSCLKSEWAINKLIKIMDYVHCSQSCIMHRKILSTLPAIHGSTF